jgi:hypothetical protein
MPMASPPIPHEVRAILDWWLPRVSGLLAGKFRSAVLYGSAAIGDFMPGWSDVDVCVILDRPVSEGEGATLGALHDDMAAHFIERGAEGWRSGQAIEGPYIPIGLASDAGASAPCYVAGGTTRRFTISHPVTPFDRYLLAHSGRTLQGPQVEFAPPEPQALAKQARTDLHLISEPHPGCLDSPIWLAGIMHWLARSIVFWRDGVMLSKTRALEREISNGSSFAGAFDLALELRRGGSALCAGRLEELRRNFLAIAPQAAGLLGELIDV